MTAGRRLDVGRLLGVPFSDQQLAAITAPLEPGVIVAGAGSGKTTVMAARVVWLVASGLVRPDEVVGLTFTNRAAAELAAKVRSALHAAGLAARGSSPAGGEEPGEPSVATYHSFAGRLLSEQGLRVGLEPDTRLLVDASRFQLAARVVRTAPGPLRQVSTDVPTLVGELLSLDAQMSEHLVEPDDVRRFSAQLVERLAAGPQQQPVQDVVAAVGKRIELLELVERYRQAKRRRAVMDFSDQMASAARLAESCPGVGAGERERYRVVLLDEYQDTSVAARRMLAGLFSGEVPGTGPGGGRGHPVTAVGDPCQAIYGWRGASVANLEEFPAHFPRADGAPARRFTLSINRRCADPILAAANRHADELYALHTGVEPLRPPAGTRRPGAVKAALHDTYAEEIDWVADEVVRTHTDPLQLSWSGIAVLLHDNADVSAVRDALLARAVPVEVVGLGGLLGLPEVVEVVSVLQVLQDLTANAALLRVLSGPRWRIGARDLALLGSRARSLARSVDNGASDAEQVHREGDAARILRRVAGGADPSEVASLCEALDDPGGLPYSPQARTRFSALRAELASLRRCTGEPLADLTRRVIETIGLDVEVGATAASVAAGRGDNLAALVAAVGDFAAAADDPSLAGLLAYLRAATDHADGLAQATPSEADSVKVLTVHKAKGLEWDVVFLPALAEGVFPNRRGRPRWVSCAGELPWPLRGDGQALPAVPDWSSAGLGDFRRAARDHDLLEEQRLGYVAITRARRLLVASGHWWGPTQVRPRGPSPYLSRLAATPGCRLGTWAPEPPEPASNPALSEAMEAAWPVEPSAATLRPLAAAAELVTQARASARSSGGHRSDPADLSPDELSQVRRWDGELDRLLDEARSAGVTTRTVELPGTISASQLLALRADPDALARELARPMPRRPARAARLGTRFHAWVEESFGQQRLLDADDLPGAADAGIDDDGELRELCEAFRTGPYGQRVPEQVEAAFSLVIGAQVVHGRIDAVYRTPQGFEVVDWKTSRADTADPMQLGIYRLAWAELAGVPADSVAAAFYYVRSGVVEHPDGLPGRPQLQRLLALR
jgi:DNA helicase-2/ATP-dependent DNA helicase PcrA